MNSGEIVSSCCSIRRQSRFTATASLVIAITQLFVAASPRAVSADLSGDLKTILSAPQLKGGIDGVMVADVETGAVLYQQDPDQLLIPASNRKMFTGAAALALMGPDRIETTDLLASEQPTAAGTIIGDLVLRGGGDPLLSVGDIDGFAADLVERGIKQVTGNIIADSSLIGGTPYGDGWQIDSLLAYYSPEIDALEANEGIVTYALHGGAKPGDPTTYDLDPPTSYVTLDNRTTTGPADSPFTATFSRPLAGTHIIAMGSVPAGKSPDPTSAHTDGRITVPSPPLFAATLLAEHLRQHGIEVDGEAQLGNTPPCDVLLETHSSLPLSKMLAAMLKPSDNLIAELLTRLESASPGHPGTYDEGCKIEDKYLATLGIGADDHQFVDGSGVSRMNYVTPRAEMTLLLALAKRPDFPTFYNAMSIMGIDGTTGSRLKGTAAGNAHVKTGTVRGCRSLSGYITAKSGKMLAFVILMNNHLISAHEMGAVQDKIVLRLAAEK